jgi:hypothetical protein
MALNVQLIKGPRPAPATATTLLDISTIKELVFVAYTGRLGKSQSAR